MPFKNQKLVVFQNFESSEIQRAVSSITKFCVQEQQLYVEIIVQKSTTAEVHRSAVSTDASKMSW